MGPAVHFISSLIGAGIVYSAFGSFASAVIFLVSGVLIDLDHIFDYVREQGLKNLSMQRLSDACHEDKFERITLFFHSFESLFLLWIIITVFKLNVLWIALALGLSFHLLIDQVANRTFVLTYFLTYRWVKKFDTKYIFKEKQRKKLCR